MLGNPEEGVLGPLGCFTGKALGTFRGRRVGGRPGGGLRSEQSPESEDSSDDMTA